MEPSKVKEEVVSETVKFRLVFLPSVEYDVVKSCIPADNLETYDALDESKIQNFRLRDSQVVFVPEIFRPALHLKAHLGESL